MSDFWHEFLNSLLNDFIAEKRTMTTLHAYLSTACIHGLHEKCNKVCKYGEPAEWCTCECHAKERALAAVDEALIGHVFYPRPVTDPLPENETPLSRAELEEQASVAQHQSALIRRLLATVEQRDRVYAAIQTDADPAGTAREVVELRDLVGQLSERIRIDRSSHQEMLERIAKVLSATRERTYYQSEMALAHIESIIKEFS